MIWYKSKRKIYIHTCAHTHVFVKKKKLKAKS